VLTEKVLFAGAQRVLEIGSQILQRSTTPGRGVLHRN